jgi:hypothetical protein
MELSITEMRDKVSLCVVDQDMDALAKIHNFLLTQSKIMDKWFDKYLDMFEKKMKPDEPNTNIWKMYHNKSNEYSELQSLIRTTDAYLRKYKSV